MTYTVIGSGVIGLSIAKAIKAHEPDAEVTIVEKELKEAMHSSGRNSGVLHAGFYYSADSLKARFTRDGNAAWRVFCEENALVINKCGKVVVAKDATELSGIEELYLRGIRNGVDVRIIDEDELFLIDPNVKTYKKALHSPDTSTVDPSMICHVLKQKLENLGVKFIFGDAYVSKSEEGIVLKSGRAVKSDKVINCAGLYADKIAHDFGFGKHYTIIPFKGIYLKYSGMSSPVRTNVYPVPNLKNPFLGVHYTITVEGMVKIGPTAIPAFWRENYTGMDGISFRELWSIVGYELKLFIKNAFGFRTLAIEEMKKYNKNYFVSLAASLVKQLDGINFREWSKPGIRAQLLNKESFELVQDFVVEADEYSIHVLNAVSPAFTAALPFGEWVVKNYIFADKR
ncbi:MAG: L-2-hydroxyglutarate oxidase [Sulfuricurvum sp.]|nr:L-2-hydroxyglutarate oxidase [Sulfuricurvum sp.]